MNGPSSRTIWAWRRSGTDRSDARHRRPATYTRTGAEPVVLKPARRVIESGWPQIRKKSPSVRDEPCRTSITPVGSSVRAGYEHPRATATPIPAGTITTRPRANTST